MLYFFFSSRRRHTRSLCDWSSDVCSSDLRGERPAVRREGEPVNLPGGYPAPGPKAPGGDVPEVEEPSQASSGHRSEERRVGKECRYRWAPYDDKKEERKETAEDKIVLIIP